MKKLLLVFTILLFGLSLAGCISEDVDDEVVLEPEVSEGIVFELKGSSNIVIKQDRIFVDEGVTARDSDNDIDLSQYVTITGQSFDTSTIGENTISYSLDYENENVTLTRTVEIIPALTKEMAYDFFSNVDLSMMDFFPDSFTGFSDIDNLVESNCIANENDKFDYGDIEYDYCLSELDNNLPMSESYIDIYSSIKQFELVEKYTNTILHSMDSVSDFTGIDGVSVPTPYGTIGMEISDEITDDSVTFEGQFSYSEVIDIALNISAELTYDKQIEVYHVKYSYDIALGYSFFGVNIYNMYTEAYIDKDYNLIQMDMYTNIPGLRTKATSLNINDDNSIEMLSYYSVLGVYESKAYIYSNDEYGYSYKVNDAIMLNPKTYFDVFTQDTMIFSYEVKGDHGTSKYYLSGLDGWAEVYYFIDNLFNNDLDSVIILDDLSEFVITEEDFDSNPLIGYIIDEENATYYYYSEDTEDIEKLVYDFETLYIYQDTDNGAENPFLIPLSLTSIILFDFESTYDEIVIDLANYKVLGIIIFSVAGFEFEIPLGE